MHRRCLLTPPRHPRHDHAAVSAYADKKRLTVALALVVGSLVTDVVLGIFAHSLALLSDAAHMVTDTGALLMSVVVIGLVSRPAKGNLTFGCLRRFALLRRGSRGRRRVQSPVLRLGRVRSFRLSSRCQQRRGLPVAGRRWPS